MLKYKVVYSEKVDGKTERVVECDYVTPPNSNDPLITFWNRTESGPHKRLLSVNPASVHQVELLEGEEQKTDDKIVDAQDPLSAEAFGHEDE